jgi:hypothetical protein
MHLMVRLCLAASTVALSCSASALAADSNEPLATTAQKTPPPDVSSVGRRRARREPGAAAPVVDSGAPIARLIDRPHTIAELEAGIIALPQAPISPGQRGGDTPLGTIGKGDATLLTGIHVLYRWRREFAIGAVTLFAPSPTSDKEYGGLRSLPRTHSRSYLSLGTEARYYPLQYKYLEAWVGLTAGAVIVADRFTTEAGDQVPTILGSREVTIRTEGFAVGVQGGATYFLSENWIAGATLRAQRWLLPESPQCSSIGDCATITGSVEAFELGLTIGYRLPL